MCARFCDDDRSHLAARADDLRVKAVELAQADLAVYAAYVRAQRAGREDEVTAALDETIRIPLELAELALELLELADGLVRTGNPRLRGDATTAVLMGAAAARAGAVLVCENLAGTRGDPRMARAGTIVAAADVTERSILSLYPALSAS
jgi:formiminotetrahydrofolate cyclodeaminase